jgi:hypothetical protein
MATYEVIVQKKEKGKIKLRKMYVNCHASGDAEREVKNQIKRNERIVDISRRSDFDNEVSYIT